MPGSRKLRSIRFVRSRGSLSVAAALAAIAAASPACAWSQPAPGTRLVARVDATHARATVGGTADGHVRLRVQPGRRRVCFKLRPRRIRSALIRGKVPGGRRGGRIRLTAGADASASGCRRAPVRTLQGLADSPESFTAILRPRGGRRPLRGRLGRAVATFETRNLSQFDAWSATNGTFSATRSRSYQGRWAAKAANIGGGTQFQRVGTTWTGVLERTSGMAWPCSCHDSPTGAGGLRSGGTTSQAVAPAPTSVALRSRMDGCRWR